MCFNSIHGGIRNAPGVCDRLIRLGDTVILSLDHESGLFQVATDIGVAQLRPNAAMLARLATLANVPLIPAAAVPDGPDGLIIHEIHEFAPRAASWR
jgi:hypothetical protein